MDDDLEFERDFCTYLNLLRGLPYNEAVTRATLDVKDAHATGGLLLEQATNNGQPVA